MIFGLDTNEVFFINFQKKKKKIATFDHADADDKLSVILTVSLFFMFATVAEQLVIFIWCIWYSEQT